MFCNLLNRDWTKVAVEAFSIWLHQRSPEKPNLIKFLKVHHAFFERLDVTFFSYGDITPDALLNEFGTAFLRRHLLVTRFLSEEFNVHLTVEQKSENAERGRIQAKLQENKAFPWGAKLILYSRWLDQTDTATRTHRLYLSCAEKFCAFVQLGDVPWSEDKIQQYLIENPGARANLFKFVGHCKRAYGWAVSVPPKFGHDVGNNAETVKELRNLLLKISMVGVESADKKLLAKVIAKSLGYPLKIIEAASISQFEIEPKTFFTHGNEITSIDGELQKVVRAYCTALQKS